MALFNFGNKTPLTADSSPEEIFLTSQMEQHVFEAVFDYFENGSTGEEYLARWSNALELVERRFIAAKVKKDVLAIPLYRFVNEIALYRRELSQTEYSKRYELTYDIYDNWGMSRSMFFYAANYIRKSGNHQKYMDTLGPRCGGYRCFPSADTFASYGKADKIAKIWLKQALKTIKIETDNAKRMINTGILNPALESWLTDCEKKYLKYRGHHDAKLNAEIQEQTRYKY
ncbi:MAG: hypothetical protein E7456_02750 [Ruminococcaceae bacterium]|nr:hypothetical protein [Oscillospiraceae bacterium]